MKIVILNGSPRPNGNTAAMVKSFKEGAESVGHEVEVVNIGLMKINGCLGCEYCHGTGNGECVQKDDMQKVYEAIADAEMVVIASPVYYWSFSGHTQSAITRIYAIGKPPKATNYAMILSYSSPGVYDALFTQYKEIVSYFGAKDRGVITAYGKQNKSEAKLKEVFDFAKNL